MPLRPGLSFLFVLLASAARAGSPVALVCSDLPGCEHLCQQGSAAGCRELAFLYRQGKGVPADGKRAAGLFAKACELSDGEACVVLSRFHAFGWAGFPKDERQAFSFAQKGCALGRADGCVAEANGYRDGLVAPKDPTRAAKLYVSACDRDAAQGCQDAGHAYLTGLGVAVDVPRALRLFERACGAGAGPSCTYLAVESRDQAGAAAAERATAYFIKGCNLDDANACAELAGRYPKGLGVAVDLAKGIAAGEKSCKLGNHDGCNNLGVIYLDAPQGARNFAKAAAAFDLGCATKAGACNGLAVTLSSKENPARDERGAVKALGRACRLGADDACAYLKQACEGGIKDACAEEKR